MNTTRRYLSIALFVAGCHGGGSGGDDKPDCVGAKRDDLDGLDEGPAGKLDLPPPRADLGVDPPQVCDASCAVLSSCLGVAEDDCLLQCSGERDAASELSSECAAAYDGALGCVAALDCEGAAAYQAGEEGYPCAAEDEAVTIACADATPPTACDAFCALAGMCQEGQAEVCAASCAEALSAAAELGSACAEAQSEVFTCAGELADCEALAAWAAAEGDYPCAEADAALVTACEAGAGG